MANLKNTQETFFSMEVSGSGGDVKLYSSINDLLADNPTGSVPNFTAARTRKLEFVATSTTHDPQQFYIIYDTTPNGNVENAPFIIKKEDLRPGMNEPYPPSEVPQQPLTASSAIFEEINNERTRTVDVRNVPSDTIFENLYSYHVIIDTGKTELPDFTDINDPERQATIDTIQSSAMFSLLSNKNIRDKISNEARQKINKSVEILKLGISNRPNSSVKVLTRIPKQLIEGIQSSSEETEGDTKRINYTHVLQTTGPELKKYLKTVLDKFNFFKNDSESFEFISLEKEAKELKKLSDKIISLYQHKNVPESSPLFFFFNEEKNYKLEAITYLSSQDLKKVKDPSKINDFVNVIDLTNTTAMSEAIFKRKRSVLYFINIDLFYSDIINNRIDKTSKDTEKPVIGIPTFQRLVKKYTYKWLETSDAPLRTVYTSKEKKAQAEIENAKRLVNKNSSRTNREIAFSTIENASKAAIADAVRTVFRNFKDPNFSEVVLNNDGQSCGLSVDYIFDDILDKIGMPKLLAYALFPDLKFPEIAAVSQEFFSLPDISFEFPDDDPILDITLGAADLALNSLTTLVGTTIGCLVTNIIEGIKASLTKANDVDNEIGTIPMSTLVSEESLTNLSEKLSSMQNVALDYFSVIQILEIITINSEPSEAIEIFEGNGNLEVIEIIGREILKQFPKLSPVLETVYETEEFLMIIGQSILEALRTAYAKSKTKKAKDLVYSSFCTEEQARLFDYISGRFPDEITRDQIISDRLRREEFANYLDDFKNAIDSDLKQFLFGDKAEELLDFAAADPTNDFVASSTVKSYFNPVGKLFNLEASDMKPYFLYPSSSIIQDSSKLVSYQYQPEKDEDDGPSPPSTNFRVFLEKKDELNSLQETLANNDSFYFSPFTLGGEKPIEYFYNFPEAMRMHGGEDLLIKPYFKLEFEKIEPVYNLDEAPTDAAGDAMKEGKEIKSIVEKTTSKITYFDGYNNVYEKERVINLENKKISNFTSQDDVGITPQGSGLGNYVKQILENYEDISDNLYGVLLDEDNNFLTNPTEEFDQLIENIKKRIFPFINQGLIRFLSEEASRSPLFSKDAIYKLNFSSSKIGENFWDIGEITQDVVKKKRYFEFLQNKNNENIFDRKPIENAILLESVDMTFRIYAVEALINGMYLYNDISLSSFKNSHNIFEIVKDNMLQELKNLGPLYEIKFATLLTQYYEIRSILPVNNNIMKPTPANISIIENGAQSIDEFACFLLQEQFEEVYEKFKIAVNKVLEKEQKLEQEDFLDIIPYMDVPRAYSWSGDIYNDLRGNKYKSRLDSVLKNGGFILERYIRNDFKPLYVSPASKEAARIVKYLPRAFTSEGLTSGDTFDVALALAPGGNYYSYKKNWEVGYSKVEGDEYYKSFGNADGVVSQAAFEEMQKKIKTENQQGVDNINPLADGSRYLNLSAQLEKLFETSDKDLAKELEKKFNEDVEEYYTLGGQIIEKLRELSKSIPSPFANNSYDIVLSQENPPNTLGKGGISSQQGLRYDWPKQMGLFDTDDDGWKKYWPGNEVVDEWAGDFPDVKDGTYTLESIFSPNVTVGEKEDFVYGGETAFISKPGRKSLEDEVSIYLEEKIISSFQDPDAATENDKEMLKNDVLNQVFSDPVTGLDQVIASFDTELELLLYLLKYSFFDQKFPGYNDRFTKNNFISHVLKGFKDYVGAAYKIVKVYNVQINLIDYILDTYNPLYKEVWNGGKLYDNLALRESLVIKKDKIQGFIDFIENENMLEILNKFDTATASLEATLDEIEDKLGLSKLGYDNVIEYLQEEISNLVDGPNATAIGGAYTNYFDTMKYGLRLSYVFPEKGPELDWISLDQTISNLTKIIGEENSNLNFKEKAFVRKYYSFETQEMKRYYSLPLIAMEDEVSNYWDKTPFIDHDIWSKYKNAFPVLKQKMIDSEDYKMIFSDMLSFGEITNTLASICAIHNKNEVIDISPFGMFSGTKINLRNVIDSLIEQRGGFDYFYENVPDFDGVLENYSKLNNPSNNPSLGSEYLKDSFGYGLLFAQKTALKILKGFVETTDPAIMAAKSIQNKLIANAQLAARVAATAQELSSEKLSGDELKEVSDALGSEVALAALTLGFSPFPLGGNVLLPITPSGMAYLSQSTTEELLSEAEESLDED